MKWEKNGQSARKKQLRFPSTSVEVLKYCKGSTTVLSKKYYSPPVKVLEYFIGSTTVQAIVYQSRPTQPIKLTLHKNT
jgi:hypothetical protein